MSKILSSHYRVERHWPHSPGRWAWVPEHENLTLKEARTLMKKDLIFEREGMRQRLVRTTTRVIKTTHSRRYSPSQMQAVRNIRGY